MTETKHGKREVAPREIRKRADTVVQHTSQDSHQHMAKHAVSVVKLTT